MIQKNWRQGTTIYQIYPRSFAGTGGSTGNLRGIINKLDYLQDLGIETLWLSPVYPSPQADFGYDITDYRGIAPEYGTLKEFDELLDSIHNRKMKLLMDMVLNHTSREHPWFLESASSRDNPRRNWYIWRDGRIRTNRNPGGRRPPNNWRSQVSGSGWHKDETTNQWYWASFLPFQPDLNWQNPEVREEMFGNLRFWLDRGVDGFRLDILGSVYEDPEFRNNPFSPHFFPSRDGRSMLFQTNIHTNNHPDNFTLARDLRRLTDSYTDSPRMLIGEVFGEPGVIRKFCGEEKPDGLHSVFLFKTAETRFRAAPLKRMMQETKKVFPAPFLPTMAFSNHDRIRRISALNNNKALYRMSLLFQATAGGIPCFYYGEEIGLAQAQIPHKNSQDAICAPFKKLPSPIFRIINNIFHSAIHRDECRTPMPWTSEKNGGFCPPDVSPWLPLQKEYKTFNVETGEADPDSLLNGFRALLSLRNTSAALRRGRLQLLNQEKNGRPLPRSILAYRREEKGEVFDVLLNFGTKPFPLDQIKDNGEIVFSTTSSRNSIRKILMPETGIVVKYQEYSR